MSEKKIQGTKGLVPVDLGRCQAQMRTGSFMTLGPREWRRCENLPRWVARETVPGLDGQQGAMSLCDECRKVMEKVVPVGVAYTPIE